MRMRGVEPPRAKARRHLKPVRLPVPPHPLNEPIITVFSPARQERRRNRAGDNKPVDAAGFADFENFNIYTAATSGRRVCNVIGPWNAKFYFTARRGLFYCADAGALFCAGSELSVASNLHFAPAG